MGETIRAEYRGRAVGTVQSGWAVGWGVAVLLQFVCYSLLPPEMAWRWMFGLGAIPAVLIFFLRRYVDEPVIAAKTRSADAAHRAKPSIWEIFAPNILKRSEERRVGK